MAVLFRDAIHSLKMGCLASGLVLVLSDTAGAVDRRTHPVLPPFIAPVPLLWSFAHWPGRFCSQTMSYPSDEELNREILKNLEEKYSDYFVMKSKITRDDLLAEFPDCCSIKPVPYAVRLLRDTRVEYRFDFRYSKYDRQLPNATLMGEATACGRLGVSQRMLECLEGYVEGSANTCSVPQKK